MIVRTDTPIHYFIKDESNKDWNSIYLKSYLEIPQRDDTSDFKQLEDIWLFIHADIENREVAHFKIEFGRHDCIGSGHKNLKELIKYQTHDAPIYNFKVATQEEYLALREKAFAIFLKHPKTDYERLTVGSEF